MKFSRRAFVKSGLLFIPALLLPRKSMAIGFSSSLAYRSQGSASGFSAKTNDWASRIVTNGGVRPNDTILTAVDVWNDGVVAASIDSKIIANCWYTVAPGAVIPNTTPYYHVTGRDPWITGMTGGNFTANGFVVNAGTSYIQTGVIPSTDFPSGNDAGVIHYLYNGFAFNSGFIIGASNVGGSNQLEVYYDGSSTFYFTEWYGGSQFITWLGPVAGTGAYAGRLSFNGWISQQRTGATAWNVYGASSTFAHQVVASSNASVAGTPPAFEVFVNNNNAGGTPGTPWGGTTNPIQTCTYFTKGLTSSEDNTLFNLTQTLLQTLGGFV